MRRVLAARPLAQCAGLLEKLRAEGWQAGHLPLMEIEPLPEALAALPAQAARADALFWVSPSAIDIGWPALAGMDFSGKRLACVGAASARRLADLSGRPVLHPTAGSDSEALLALPELADASGQRWLIVRGQGGRPLLADTLAARGAEVGVAEVYRRVDGAPDWAAFDAAPPDAVIITSGEMVEQLFRLAGPRRTGALQCLLYCVPHPRIAERLAAFGAARIVTTRADDAALVAGLKEWFRRHP
ncbi:uroporphyrinogen-III synthase [Chromobacterium violaceum]|uniref:uroporphyrinogen-III synthase n=1 Tax=Chromobacterium violaceum TaxID=536 RepID=UPI0005E91385|nr:uroporphyrinogen-III synthase [Chromobacterium violaceum]KJH67600.1 uroporphyrinogen III synthase [Chromobacterium violaceum]MBX9266238.1 uroporphyrinogen-III synthase [Chromobacterium violaceum]QIY79499.1 uroporphyrinogen-III synthase [Chromobacterium violaceum]